MNHAVQEIALVPNMPAVANAAVLQQILTAVNNLQAAVTNLTNIQNNIQNKIQNDIAGIQNS